MTLASWLAGATRRIRQTYQTLIAGGKSPKRAHQLIKVVEDAPIEAFKAVKGSKGARYFLPGAPKTAPTISRTEFIKRKYGAAPKVLAAKRKAGLREYETAASEEQARKQIETRRRFSRVGTWRRPNEEAAPSPCTTSTAKPLWARLILRTSALKVSTS